MKDFYFLEDTLADVLEIEKEKLELEKEIKSSKSRISNEQNNGKTLSNELMNLKNKYNESAMKQKIVTLGEGIAELKESKSEIKNKMKTLEINKEKSMIYFGVLLAVLVLIGGIDLHRDLQNMPYVCNNEEIVMASDVNNGVDNCTDGSDEGDTWLGSSRAEEYEMDVSNGSFMTTIMAPIFFIPASCYTVYQSRENKKLFTMMIILVCSSSVGLYSTLDLSKTWECDDGEQIHWSWVQDGKQSCDDGTDERKSGFFDDLTRSESFDGPVDTLMFDFWYLSGFILLIWWLLNNFVFTQENTYDVLEEEKEINRVLNSKKKESSRLKKDLERMKKLPNLIKLSNDLVTDLEVKNANAVARVLNLKISISNNMEKISHLIPYNDDIQ